MFRIDNNTSADTLPTIPDAGDEGFFRPGNPSIGQEATDVDVWWLNMMQEELRAIVVGAGLTPAKNNNGQVYAAIQALIAGQTLGGLDNVTETSPANGEALVWNGSAWVNGTPASAIDQVYKTLLLNGLGDAIAEGAGTQQVNTWPDPFVGTTGIDTGASSGYLHDATRDVIHNGSDTVTPSVVGEWNGATGNFTFSGDDILNTTNDRAIRTNDSFTGDFSFTWINQAGGSYFIGLYEVASDGTFNQSTNDADVYGVTGIAGSWSLHIEGAAYDIYGGTSTEDTGIAVSAADVFIISRSGSTWTLKQNGSTVHTWTKTGSTEVRIALANGSNPAMDIDDVSWTVPGTPTNMDLISVQRTPLAVPATGHLLALINNLGSLTYGTDLTMSVSRDDGDTWDTATIEELGTTSVSINGTPTDCDVIYIEDTFTGASETNLRARLQSFNNKSFELAGWIPAAS